MCSAVHARTKESDTIECFLGVKLNLTLSSSIDTLRTEDGDAIRKLDEEPFKQLYRL